VAAATFMDRNPWQLLYVVTNRYLLAIGLVTCGVLGWPLTAGSTGSAKVAIDREIVPGKRVGKIVKTTTKADLTRIFGPKNLVDTITADPGSATSFPATLIKDGKNYVLLVQWKDRSQRQVQRVRILNSRWQTAEGIKLGATVPQLQKILGNFQLYG
jgi:hypothetical protein